MIPVPPRVLYQSYPGWREACLSGPDAMDAIVLQCIQEIRPPLDGDACLTLARAFHLFCLHGKRDDAYSALAMLETASPEAEFGPGVLQAGHALLYLDDIGTATRLLDRDREAARQDSEWTAYVADCVELAIEARRDPGSEACRQALGSVAGRLDDQISYNDWLADACARLALVGECRPVIDRLTAAMERNRVDIAAVIQAWGDAQREPPE